MMLLATEKSGQNTAIFEIIELIIFLFIIGWPIVAVWHWSFLGVFIGALTSEAINILSTVLIYQLKSEELNYENYEAWQMWAIYIFAYSLFIWLIKMFIKICLKVISRSPSSRRLS